MFSLTCERFSINSLLKAFNHITEIDECASNPCISEAMCVDKVNGFICMCPPGFTGVQCEISKLSLIDGTIDIFSKCLVY